MTNTYTCKCCGGSRDIPADELAAQLDRLDRLDRLADTCQWGITPAPTIGAVTARCAWDTTMAQCSEYEAKYC